MITMRRMAVVGLLAIVAGMSHGSVIKPSEIELEGRIVGGKNGDIENFPYMVSVRVFGYHYCGGSIIRKDVIISAAHCIDYHIVANNYSIQYGLSNIGGTKNVITAKRLLPHENFHPLTFSNDIALIFLVSDIPISTVAQPIQLPTSATAVGVFANITGWGVLQENGNQARTLQHVSVQIMHVSVCQEQYKTFIDTSETMVCAGVTGGGKDACQQDSGGPLSHNNTLVGIVSFGNGCARPNFFGVYSNVTDLKKWIDLNVA